MLLHVAASAAGVTEDERRLIQRNVGGFHSAADPTTTREGFIAVMAFYESRCGGALAGFTAGYWQREDAKANPTDALIYRLRQEARSLGISDRQLDLFIAGKHMSGGACDSVETATAYWLRRCLEALKAIAKRAATRPVPAQAIGLPPAAGPQPGQGALRREPGAPPAPFTTEAQRIERCRQ